MKKILTLFLILSFCTLLTGCFGQSKLEKDIEKIGYILSSYTKDSVKYNNNALPNKTKDLNILRILVLFGFDINGIGLEYQTPLMNAIIENNNEFVDMLNMNVNLKVINVFDEILKFKLKNNIILYPSPKKLSQITNSFSEILNEKLEFEKKSFKFFLKNDVNKLKNNEDYEHFINITINKITKGILENIFYTMCFVDDSLFNKFKEENLFKLFIDNYQSVFKYPIDENKISYENMLTNIKNINNELMLNYPSLNVLDRLNHFTEILNDFKSVKSKKIKI